MLADAQWTKLEPLIEACRPKGKTPPQDLGHPLAASERSEVAPLCCTGRGSGRTGPYPVPGSCDADGLRASQLQHAVERVDADVDLGHAAPVGARVQPV